MVQSAPIRNPPCVNRNIASRVRTWNCTGPRTASKLVPQAPEGGVLRHCFERIPNPPTKAGLEGIRRRDIAKSRASVRNPPIRKPRNPLLLAREKP
eukprot:7862221-Alexandrium_andersonii.AAC.1